MIPHSVLDNRKAMIKMTLPPTRGKRAIY